MATAKKIDTTIGLRISTENKDIIRLAAECTGQDLTSYLISTALQKAKTDISEYQEVKSLMLSQRDFDKVEKELKNPSKPNAKMKKAFNKHTKAMKR